MIGPIEDSVPAPEISSSELVEALRELEVDQSRVFDIEPYRLSPYLSIYGRKWKRRFTAKLLHQPAEALPREHKVIRKPQVRVWRVE